MKNETGGQAFPRLERGGSGLDLTDGGMTLRQYAVIKFIAAEISREGLEGGEIEKIVAMAHEYVTELLECGK